MLQLREVLVDAALKCPVEDDDNQLGTPLLFRKIPVFQKELKAWLDKEVPTARDRFHAGDFPIPNRIKKCRTYPIYKFVRSQLGTDLLSGAKTRSPGEDIEKVYRGICKSEKVFGEVVVKCLDMWRGSAGPFTSRPQHPPVSPAPFNASYWSWFDTAKSPSATSGRGFWNSANATL
ncbi:hypothetical protein SUGI_1187060 [Cryptomeria japonica]|uniref:phenylalanine ammonia-lyase-like n=1 Tax=Cryptomeria japonica TaxID=3369 RepID=UPI002414BADD|nr:phenylalanine ammonia-lyase-like [Cryptomeria japonica]GLJ55320.1 hypothetical protein SUGI_1187060 [Cryptomeria japonica]